MFTLFPQQMDNLLDVDSLPSTEGTELNYRTRPLTAEQEVRLVIFILALAVPSLILLTAIMRTLSLIHPYLGSLILSAVPVSAIWLMLRKLTGAIMWHDLVWSSLLALGAFGSVAWSCAFQLDSWTLPVALGLCAMVTSWMTHQVATWILVGPTVDRTRMDRWRLSLPAPLCGGYTADCPELLTYSVSPMLITIAWTLTSIDLGHAGLNAWLWPWTFAIALQGVWFAWHVAAAYWMPWPNWLQSWRWTWRAFVIFLTYDIYATPAAGVFRFPTRWLRKPQIRWASVILTMLLVSFGFAIRCPNPVAYQSWITGWFGPIVIHFIVVSLTGPVVLACILWSMAGTVLARLDAELSRHLDPDRCDWDNYVERIQHSGDTLERDHLFIGLSETGDFPIMVHQAIHDQHCHITGDTGGNKTALGVAPQVMQKIARRDNTVVVIDLKGDLALFEGCRLAAERSNLRFRWLANEVGRTTFAFNPLVQSHNAKLTVEQMTQELLQGLALDYGLDYGAGYFTAMNEIVLKNVLAESGAKSFRELGERLADRKWYRSIGGYEEDWKQARHLGAMVSRLAGCPLLNVSPSSFADQPEVHREAIDVCQLWEEPQVLYLWLRSAVEPTNAPTIARLLLWSMYTAASHQPLDRHRVYFFIDEMQQVISEGIKLIFEQFRDMGGTIIGAHQTIGQLRRQGADLGDTIDSCTAMKQVFRASDEVTLERLEKLSGTRREISPTWHQIYERGTGDLTERYSPHHAEEGSVRVTDQVMPRYDCNELLAISSRPQSSLVRFTFGSGYTQFGGATIPVRSLYHIPREVYLRRRQASWPDAPGAFAVTLQAPSSDKQACPSSSQAEGDSVGPSAAEEPVPDDGFGDVFEQRARQTRADWKPPTG